MTTEIELKYLLMPAEDLSSEINVVEKITQILTKQSFLFKTEQKTLSNYYLDTPELALRQLDMGLRVRGIQLGGQALHYEQTIKTAGEVIGGLHKRPEYNVDIDDDKVKLVLFPAEIWQNNSANVVNLQNRIVRLFNTHFARVTWTITVGNSVVELAFDQGIISCDDFDKTDVIYEIEIELVSGEQQALFTLAKQLLAHFPMRPGHLSKAARGYTLAAEFFQLKNTQIKEVENKAGNIATTIKLNHLPIKTVLTQEELILEVIPMQSQHTISEVFRCGLDFSLTKLQCRVDDYIQNPSFICLIKINELLALIRQGFWLFEQELTLAQLAIRNELGYFIDQFHWLDHAKHLQELISKSGAYGKKLAHSHELITALQLKNKQFPSVNDVVKLFHSERFNLLQLSLLELLLDRQILTKEQATQETQQALIMFAQTKLNSALNNISNEMHKPADLPISQVMDKYISIHSLLMQNLLTGSWFSSLFGDTNNQQKVVDYGKSWLDIEQGISELQTLRLLQQQLMILQHSEGKLVVWLNSKIENLLQAIKQSQLSALNVAPYWQE